MPVFDRFGTGAQTYTLLPKSPVLIEGLTFFVYFIQNSICNHHLFSSLCQKSLLAHFYSRTLYSYIESRTEEGNQIWLLLIELLDPKSGQKLERRKRIDNDIRHIIFWWSRPKKSIIRWNCWFKRAVPI